MFKPQIVAVYGTLRPGFGNWRGTGLNTQEYLGIDKTEPKFNIENWIGYPGMFHGGKTSVTVSLFKVVDEKVFQNLDWLESHQDGVKSGFHRERITTLGGVEAWTYVYYGSEDPAARVKSGDWKLEKIGEYDESKYLNNAEEE